MLQILLNSRHLALKNNKNNNNNTNNHNVYYTGARHLALHEYQHLADMSGVCF
jgi:hypothetical protein